MCQRIGYGPVHFFSHTLMLLFQIDGRIVVRLLAAVPALAGVEAVVCSPRVEARADRARCAPSRCT